MQRSNARVFHRPVSQAAFPAEVSREDQKKNKWANLPELEIAHHLNDDELNEEAKSRGIENPQPSLWKNTGLFDETFRIQIIERSEMYHF